MSAPRLRYPKTGHPIDLGDGMLFELATLFLAESAADQRAGRVVEAQRKHDVSHEIAEIAVIAEHRRLHDEQRQLAPFQVQAKLALGTFRDVGDSPVCMLRPRR